MKHDRYPFHITSLFTHTDINKERGLVDKKVLDKVLSGLSDKNIRFQNLKKLLNDVGFSVRIKGDHHIFYKEGIEEIINLQPLRDGKAKAYQVKQVRAIILKYKFHGEV
jgi:hypothetical protein